VTDNPVFTRLHQPGVGDYFAPGLPAAIDGAHPPSAPAPGLGQDTAGVLAEYLGLPTADIERLVSAKTIAC
jgi:2-methylfumaryl-CoA isomerase